LAWQPAKKEVLFRVLREEPLAGAVASSGG